MNLAKHSISPGTVTFDLAGSWGRWQLQFFLLFGFFSFLYPWHALQYAFLAPNIDFWCANDSPTNGSLNVCSSDCTKWSYNVGLPSTENSSSSSSPAFYRSTILSEWDLVCDRAWLARLSHTTYMAGSFIAAFLCGHASDRFGRKPTLLFGWTVSLLGSLSAAISPSYLLFLASRFLIGLGMTTCQTIGSVLILEITGTQYREVVGLTVGLGWPFGYSILPAIVWYLRDFRHLLYVCTGVQLCFLLAYKWAYESPRWLLAKGRYGEACCVLKNAVKLNGKNVNVDEVIAKIENENLMMATKESSKKQYSFLDLFTNWKMVHLTGTFFFLWFSNAFVYYGISLNTNALAGDPLLNFFLMGVVEIPSSVSSIYLVKFFGAKRSFILSLIGAGLSCWASVSISFSHSLGIAFTMFGKFWITVSYDIAYIYTPQAFPTVVRTIALGSCSMVSRVGFLLAPYLGELSRKTSFTFSMAVVGLISIAAGMAILPLTDSTGNEMPDIPEDLENTVDRKMKQTSKLELENLHKAN